MFKNCTTDSFYETRRPGFGFSSVKIVSEPEFPENRLVDKAD